MGKDGRDKESIRSIRRKIGLVFQSPEASFVAKNVLQEVMFTPLNFLSDEKAARTMAEESLKDFNLSGYEERCVDELSGGEKQRLMLASIFVMDPEIIILDEAFTFLDQASRDLLSDLILKKKEEGKGIISVTHDAKIAGSAERIILMKDGTILKDGRSDDILSDVPLLISADVRPRDEDLFLFFLRGGVHDRT